MVYVLKDDEGRVVAKFVPEDEKYTYVDGECYVAESWGESIVWNFVAEVYCKWDSCTHWWFCGEEWKRSNKKDSYYHLCGSGVFVDHIRCMCFVWRVAKMHMSKFAPNDEYSQMISDNYDDYAKCVKLVDFMLDGYTIEEFEEDI